MDKKSKHENINPIGANNASKPLGYYNPTSKKKKKHVWLWVILGIVVISGAWGKARTTASSDNNETVNDERSVILETVADEDSLTTLDSKNATQEGISLKEEPESDSSAKIELPVEDDTVANIESSLSTTDHNLLENDDITAVQNQTDSVQSILAEQAPSTGISEIQPLDNTVISEQEPPITREVTDTSGGPDDPYWLQNTYEKDRILEDSVEKVYAVNKNTKKIHELDCNQVEKILPENYDETNDPESLIAQGFTWCKRCH